MFNQWRYPGDFCWILSCFAEETHFSTMNAVVVEFIHVEDLTISTTSEAFHSATLHEHKSASTSMKVQAKVGETTSFSFDVEKTMEWFAYIIIM